MFFSINCRIFSALPGLILSCSCQQHPVFPLIGSLRAKSHVCRNKSLSGRGLSHDLTCAGNAWGAWASGCQAEFSHHQKIIKLKTQQGMGLWRCVCVGGVGGGGGGGIAPFCVQTYQFHFHKKHPHRICTCMYILYILIILILFCVNSVFCSGWGGWGDGGWGGGGGTESEMNSKHISSTWKYCSAMKARQ